MSSSWSFARRNQPKKLATLTRLLAIWSAPTSWADFNKMARQKPFKDVGLGLTSSRRARSLWPAIPNFWRRDKDSLGIGSRWKHWRCQCEPVPANADTGRFGDDHEERNLAGFFGKGRRRNPQTRLPLLMIEHRASDDHFIRFRSLHKGRNPLAHRLCRTNCAA